MAPPGCSSSRCRPRELLGLLLLGAGDAHGFDTGDLELLTLAADRMAIAIDHVQRFADGRQLVETLQRSLLPDRLPRSSAVWSWPRAISPAGSRRRSAATGTTRSSSTATAPR